MELDEETAALLGHGESFEGLHGAVFSGRRVAGRATWTNETRTQAKVSPELRHKQVFNYRAALARRKAANRKHMTPNDYAAQIERISAALEKERDFRRLEQVRYLREIELLKKERDELRSDLNFWEATGMSPENVP